MSRIFSKQLAKKVNMPRPQKKKKVLSIIRVVVATLHTDLSGEKKYSDKKYFI